MHTFLILAFRWRPDPSPRIAIAVVILIWVFVFMIQVVIFGSHKTHFYGSTQYCQSSPRRAYRRADGVKGCWITSDYPGERLGLEYVWMWITCLLNFVLYTVLIFVVKGYVVFNGWKVRFPRQEDRVKVRSSSSSSNTSYAKDASDIAWRMIFVCIPPSFRSSCKLTYHCRQYPVIYTVTVIPIAVVRWSAFFHSINVPFWATVLADLIFACSGLLNVLLFTFTRPMLVPKRSRRTTLTITPFTSLNSSSRVGGGASSEDQWVVAPRYSYEHSPLERKRSILQLHPPRSPESAV